MRMDAVEHPAPVEPPKKALSKGMIIGIVAGAVVLVCAIVGIIIALNSGKEEKPIVTTSYPDEPETPEIDEEMAERNKQRAKDLEVVAEAVKTYQANYGSELPGPDVEDWEKMIARYVPKGVKDSVTGEEYSVGAVCKFGEECVTTQNLSYENNKYQIYALYNADCKGTTKDNVIVSSTRKRRVAIFAVIEGDQFICTTN